MKTSEYMDKEITGLSRSLSDDLFGHGNTRDDYDYEDSLSPRFGLYPSQPQTSADAGKVRSSFDEALLSLIDRRMKEHTDEVLHAVNSVSAQLTQLESRTRRMENAVDDLKESLNSYHGRADGKLRELEHLLREVQDCTRDIRDKQEIAEARIELSKLAMSKVQAHLKKPETTAQTEAVQEASSSVPQQSAQSLPIPIPMAASQQASTLPAHISPHSPHINPSPAPQLPPPSVPPPPPEVYYQIPPIPHSQSAPPQPHHLPYQPSPIPPPRIYEFHQQPVIPTPPPPTQQAPSSVHCNDFLHYSPWLSGESTHNPFYSPLIGGSFQQFDSPYLKPPEQPTNRRYMDVPSHPSMDSDFNSLSRGSRGNPTVETSNPMQSSNNGGYSELPTARILPQALPTVSIKDPQRSPDRSTNKEPADDVVDRVVGMGFRRDVVRATVKRLEDGGQPVDLNVVLDILTNEGQNR
ncbi:pollen-specific leucine-rich repeat extensin-like protein 1 [Punica granatum]|uniref:Uncharacterized protein n=2 Tax=Punica granatum TaxID=22663 RepID=A0A2I0JTA4_PUNGR|nr:pollen-specific leucine-rich repeat extensin-like protein 1 [Punica granatum]PKI59103.1 hypothetical protein CRG98_020469 [Punica granatum]